MSGQSWWSHQQKHGQRRLLPSGSQCKIDGVLQRFLNRPVDRVSNPRLDTQPPRCGQDVLWRSQPPLLEAKRRPCPPSRLSVAMSRPWRDAERDARRPVCVSQMKKSVLTEASRERGFNHRRAQVLLVLKSLPRHRWQRLHGRMTTIQVMNWNVDWCGERGRAIVDMPCCPYCSSSAQAAPLS